MADEHEVSSSYTDATLRLAARCFLRRMLLRDVIVWGTCGLVGFGALWWFDLDRSAALLLIGGPIIVIAVGVFVGLANVRGASAKIRRLKDRKLRWQFRDESFVTKSDTESVEYRWENVVEMWRFSQVWLLFFGPRHWGYSILPTQHVSPELQEYILSRVKAHGGRIA